MFGSRMNYLYYGDNLPVLREYVKDEAVDLEELLEEKKIEYPQTNVMFKQAPKAKGKSPE